MKKNVDVFCEVACLTEQSQQLSGISLHKKWFKAADKRAIGQVLQKFIHYNAANFEFLGVEPLISGADVNISLSFRTSGFVGCVPLRAPDTGKQIGDFVVSPRFIGKDRFEDYIGILNLLDEDISPEISPTLPLASGRNYRPPFYLEAVKFIKLLEELVAKHWKKFDCIELDSPKPSGQVNWAKYIRNEHRVERRLIFPVRRNVLSEFHSEYSQICYVFELCKAELLSANTPVKIKNSIRSRVQFIEEKMRLHKPIKVDSIGIRSADAPIVRLCKDQANKLLKRNFSESTAWRVDYTDVFEKFVQHIFKEISKETGARLFTNAKFRLKATYPFSWMLKYVEPDVVYQKENLIVFIDAKYKSILFHKHDLSRKLDEDHRQDLHQILAYMSFCDLREKHGILCYPALKFEAKSIVYENNINNNKNIISIIGIPLNIDFLHDVKRSLLKEIDDFCKIN